MHAVRRGGGGFVGERERERERRTRHDDRGCLLPTNCPVISCHAWGGRKMEGFPAFPSSLLCTAVFCSALQSSPWNRSIVYPSSLEAQCVALPRRTSSGPQTSPVRMPCTAVIGLVILASLFPIAVQLGRVRPLRPAEEADCHLPFTTTLYRTLAKAHRSGRARSATFPPTPEDACANLACAYTT
ncbi:hypothetical protein LZ30DRAFT_740877 [Colletotrichum cereale]|nr:hypothetical protein LZ30DRAFT_740877 [Colletotrichum cereale]